MLGESVTGVSLVKGMTPEEQPPNPVASLRPKLHPRGFEKTGVAVSFLELWEWEVTLAGDAPPTPQPYAIDAGLPPNGGIVLCELSKPRLVQPLFNGGGGPLPLLMARIAELGAANAVLPAASAPS